MNKFQVIERIKEVGVVAVIRGNMPEEALAQAEACIAGGVTSIEIAFTTPRAHEAIKMLAEKYAHDPSILVGAGTVLDAETARIAILYGAQFVVSPYFDKETMLLCNRYRVPCMPGTTTIQGVVEALEYGADIVKIFPGEVVGKNMIKALKGPVPQAELMPTGGVSIDNVHEWLEAGSVAVGVGGALTGKGKSAEEITSLAKRFVEAVASYRA